MLRPVSEVADRDRLIVTLIQFAKTADDTTWVSFAIWLKLVPSGLLRMLLNTLVFLFVAKKAGAQWFIIDARASKRHVFETSIWIVAHRRGPEDAQNWFVGSADIKNAFHQMPFLDGCRRFLHCSLCSHPKLVTRGKRLINNVLLPIL